MSETIKRQLAALEEAYASGVTSVSYGGKTVNYDSADKLLARINRLKRLIAGPSDRKSRRRVGVMVSS